MRDRSAPLSRGRPGRARLGQDGRAAARHRPGRVDAAGADARLHEPRGAGGDAGRRLRDLLQPLEGAALAEGRDVAATISPSARSRSIATATPCWCWPSRPARPAISARRAASATRRRPAWAGSASFRRIVRARAESGESGSYTARLLARGSAAHRPEDRRGRRRAGARRRRRRPRPVHRGGGGPPLPSGVLMQAQGLRLGRGRADADASGTTGEGSDLKHRAPPASKRLRLAAARTWPAPRSSPPRQLPIMPPAPLTTGTSAL